MSAVGKSSSPRAPNVMDVMAVITKARKMAVPTVWLAVSPNKIMRMGTTRTPPPMAVAPTRAPHMEPTAITKPLLVRG